MVAFRPLRRRPSYRDPLYENPRFVALLGRLCENLKRARQRRGMSQLAAAKACGMSQQHWQQLERGVSNPTLTTLVRVAEAVGVDAADLLRERMPTKRKSGAAVSESAEAAKQSSLPPTPGTSPSKRAPSVRVPRRTGRRRSV